MRKKIVWLPYDMDTALGINNEGALVFDYHLEDKDTVGGEDVFNGQNSVFWCNLRDMFQRELKEMYQQIRSEGKLSYETIEKAFEDHQAKWPEAIINEDSQYKYLDPMDDGDETYLPMLQGTKTEQRRWWLYNRFRYMDSKYNAGSALTDYIQLRGYNKANITVTPYADIYPTIKYGSYLVAKRGTRNQACLLECPLDQLNDTEIYIYSASAISSVGDLSPLKVGLADLSRAVKLTEVKLGDAAQGYENRNMYALSLGNNRLLRKIDVRNCSGLGDATLPGHTQRSVDLSGCTGLQEAYFDGTNVLGVSLPNGGELRKLHLPGTITNLTVRNQTQMTEFVCPDYSHITTLWLENPSSAVDTLQIIEDMGTGSRVRLYNFEWEMEDLDDVAAIFDKLDTMSGLDQNGINTNRAQVYGTIRVATAQGNQYDSIRTRYPDVNIIVADLSPVIVYMNDDGTQTMYTEEVPSGGNGTRLLPDAKASDVQYDYTPLGWSTNIGGAADASALNGVTTSRTVYAVYSRTTRSYQIQFVRDAQDGGGVLETDSVPYGTVPSYGGNDPASTRGDTYQFIEWSPALTAVTGNATYTAVFQEPVTLSYFSDDGATLLHTEQVRYGGNGKWASQPAKDPSAQYTYAFSGWSRTQGGAANANARANMTANRSVYAAYTPSVRQYTVSFVKAAIDGGETLQTGQLNYGSIPYYTGSTPVSSNSDGGQYTFAGWTPSISAVTGDATYTAVFNDQRLVVTFKDGTTTLKTVRVAYGQTAEYGGANPTKSTTVSASYSFLGWSIYDDGTVDEDALWNVRQNRTVYAVWEETPRTYTVTFVKASEDGGGTLATYNLMYGAVPAYSGSTPTTTKSGHYEFKGWTPAITAVSGPATYTAVFEEITSPVVLFVERTLTSYESDTASVIDGDAFYFMSDLATVRTSATTVGNAAFASCRNLTTAEFTSSSAITFGHSVFKGVSVLESLTIRSNSVASVSEYSTGNSDMFYGTAIANGTGSIYVPSSLVSQYASDTYWSQYADRIQAIQE